LWLLAAVPARYFFGTAGIAASSVSAATCLVGGWVTFWFAAHAKGARLQAFAVLSGTLIRGSFALAGALVMQFLLGLAQENYLIWLGLFYLTSLALETVMMLGSPAGTKAA
jgi:hypothetical protein